jgi:tRNA(fMet)-specific endonuclease VapC
VAVLIDTDMLVDLERGVANPAVDEAIGGEDREISIVTVSELLHGVYRAKGAQRTRRSAFVEYLLADLQAIPITDRVARVHADVWARLATRGQVIGAHDLWIAATALAHGLGIVTGDADEFGRIPGLRVVPAPV